MKRGWTKISKKDWYYLGGFANPWLHRVQRSHGWEYYRHD